MMTTGRGWWPRWDRRSPSLAFRIMAAAALIAVGVMACSRAASRPVRTRSELTIGVALPRGSEVFGLRSLLGSVSTETLLTLGDDGRPEPRLVRSWGRSADGLTWTLSLQPNIFFQDGRRATSAVVATFLRSVASDPSVRGVRPNLADIDSITTADENTVVIHTRMARALLLDQLADLAIPSTPKDGALGAFLPEASAGDTASFRAFDKYYRARPGVEKVTYRSYRSLRAAWAAMMRGETDAIYELGRDAGEFVQAESGVRVYPFVRPFATSVIFNVQRPALRSAAVRRALSSMIDRNEILRIAYRENGMVADGPLWPFHWAIANRHPGTSAPVSAPLFPEGRRLQFTCLVAPEIAPWERVALLIQKQLYDHGVDMRLEAVTLNEMMVRIQSGNFDAALGEFLGRTPNWLYSFWHSPVPGAQVIFRTGYAAADQPFDRLLAAGNDEEIRRGIDDVYRAMENDPPAIFIAWPEVRRVMTRDFETSAPARRDVFASNSLWMVRPAGTTP